MTLKEVSVKADISYSTSRTYYKRYLDDPDHSIPVPYYCQYYTREHKNKLINYIVNDKMSIRAASKKAGINTAIALTYYHRHFKSHGTVKPRHIVSHKYPTQEQKDEFISYIVNNKMNINAAARKVNMNVNTGRHYYHKYFKKQHPDIPTPSHITTFKRYTQEQIKQVISYIVDDKMSVRAASRKGNMVPETAGKYYRQYLKDNNMELLVSRKRKSYTQDQKDKLIRYIVDDKMTIAAASIKVNIVDTTARIYYWKYLKDQNYDIRRH